MSDHLILRTQSFTNQTKSDSLVENINHHQFRALAIIFEVKMNRLDAQLILKSHWCQHLCDQNPQISCQMQTKKISNWLFFFKPPTKNGSGKTHRSLYVTCLMLLPHADQQQSKKFNRAAIHNTHTHTHWRQTAIHNTSYNIAHPVRIEIFSPNNTQLTNLTTFMTAMVITNNNNNNDRLTAFDPGQPG